jgi:hypothetical protein
MKKIIGIVLVVWAVLSGVNVANKLSQASGTGNSAYDSGKKTGMIAAPIVLGGVGLWLLFASSVARFSSPGSMETRQRSLKPLWWTLGGFAGVIVLVLVVSVISRTLRHRAGPPPPSLTASGVQTPPGQSAEIVTYSVGERVQAKWANAWIPGTITAVNPGGFSMMVKLDDSRFPRPIVLSTHQLKKQ